MLGIFSKKKPKIEVFVRHCHFSSISHHKGRLPGYSREKCHENLLQTCAKEKVNITFLLDSFYPMEGEHFVKKQATYPVIEIKEGCETGSFLKLLEHVEKLKLPSETILYFLEDDYLHKPDWTHILEEAFTIPEAEYVTLYDHKDKYFLPSYQNLSAKLFHTASCHWRTTPSTTNTYAMKYKTLKRDMDIHKEFSVGRKISDDHGKFCKLSSLGHLLISPLPGWSTHTEPDYASPCVDWNQFL